MQFVTRKGAWEGGRKSEDQQITKSRWQLVFLPKVLQTKKGNCTTLFGWQSPCLNETCLNSLSTYSQDGIDHSFRDIHKMSTRKTGSVDLTGK